MSRSNGNRDAGYPLLRIADGMNVTSPTSTLWGSWQERIPCAPSYSIADQDCLGGRSAGGLRRVGLPSGRRADPVAMLTVSKKILDAVQAHYAGQALPVHFWWLVGAEFALAALGATPAGRLGISIRSSPTVSRVT
jgi:hypothetical protein